MTINNTQAQVTYNGNGSQTYFSYNFRIPYQDDGTTPAVILIQTDASGNITYPQLGTDFTIAGVDNPDGGSVVFPITGSSYATLASGWTLQIARNLAYTQGTSFPNQGLFPQDIETALDRMEMQLQQKAALYNGTQGPQGPAGPTGPQGPPGPAGSGGSLSIGVTPISGGSGTTKVLVDNGGTLAETNTPTFATVVLTASISPSGNVGALSYGTLGYSDVNIFSSFTASVNNYAQQILQNTNNGAAASADFIVSNDTGTASNSYGDFGINSSGFSGTGSFQAAGAVYLYSQGQDLVIGTKSNNLLRFVTNNGATDVMSFDGSGGIKFGGVAPSLVAGTNVSITGTWPNQTINASGGGGSTTYEYAAIQYIYSSNGAYEFAGLDFQDASGTSLVGGGTALGNGTSPGNAFDGNASTDTSGGNWIGYHFTSAVAVGKVVMTAANSIFSDRTPLIYDIVVSHDGKTWKPLGKVIDTANFAYGEVRTYTIPS